MKALFLILIGMAIVGLLGCDVVTAPARVINKTVETNNIILSYEWFKDANQAYYSKINQIAQYKGFLEAEKDVSERQRLRMECAAIQQSCRDLVSSYNSNASKMNKSIFMGRDTPSSLSLNLCEL